MAEMELVIKIPEGLKNDFESEQWTALSCMEMKDALEKATPLPKGHGDLKDEREVVNILLKYAHSEQGKSFANFLVSEIKDAPTIIEGSESE